MITFVAINLNMGLIRKIDNWLLPLLLSISLLMVFNATVNTHTHILSDGTIVVHAHPFKTITKSDAGTERQSHSHTQKEFDMLSSFSCAFQLVVLAIVIIAATLLTKKALLSRYSEPIWNNLYIASALYRGPPSL